MAREQVGYDPPSGALFVFFGRRRDALKILFFDGSGMCVFYKRLDKGTFRLSEAPEPGARHVEVDDAVLDALLDGVAIEGKGKTSRALKKGEKRAISDRRIERTSLRMARAGARAPSQRIELFDAALEGKAECIGLEERYRPGYRRGGPVRILSGGPPTTHLGPKHTRGHPGGS